MKDTNTAVGPTVYYDYASPRFVFRFYAATGEITGGIIYTAAGTPAINTNYTFACGYKTNSFALSVNGNTVAQDTTGDVSGTPDTLRIGRNTSNIYLNGYVQNLIYYPLRINNAEIRAFSKI